MPQPKADTGTIVMDRAHMEGGCPRSQEGYRGEKIFQKHRRENGGQGSV